MTKEIQATTAEKIRISKEWDERAVLQQEQQAAREKLYLAQRQQNQGTK